MTYLIVQTFILLLFAGLLGLILGWYLTRLSLASARSDLQALLRVAKDDAKALRSELDAMTTARHNGDIERRLLSDELAGLRARQDVAQRTVDNGESIAELQTELERCREALAAVGTAASGGAGGDDFPVDDLERIKGIGPKIAGMLRELGVQRFEQIADWSPEEVDRVNGCLRFKGRIEREEWIPQARALIAARDN